MEYGDDRDNCHTERRRIGNEGTQTIEPQSEAETEAGILGQVG